MYQMQTKTSPVGNSKVGKHVINIGIENASNACLLSVNYEGQLCRS